MSDTSDTTRVFCTECEYPYDPAYGRPPSLLPLVCYAPQAQGVDYVRGGIKRTYCTELNGSGKCKYYRPKGGVA